MTAILLIGIIFFDWYGYRLLTMWWELRADRLLEARLDVDDYEASSLFFIKVPVHSLSYYNGSSEFERVDGEIIIGDVAYKFVKRRLFRDSLELMCVVNEAAMEMERARNDLSRNSNTPKQERSPQQKDYSPAILDYIFHAYTEAGRVTSAGFIHPALPDGFVGATEKPPCS